MIHDAAVLLHGSAEELLFSDYLYRVGLHLLAVAAVGVCVHWVTSVIGRTPVETVVERDGEESEQ